MKSMNCKNRWTSRVAVEPDQTGELGKFEAKINERLEVPGRYGLNLHCTTFPATEGNNVGDPRSVVHP